MLDFLSLLWDKDREVPNKGWIVLAFTNLADLESAQSSYWSISSHLVFQLQGSALPVQLSARNTKNTGQKPRWSTGRKNSMYLGTERRRLSVIKRRQAERRWGHPMYWCYQPISHLGALTSPIWMPLLPAATGRKPCGSLRPPPAPEGTRMPWQSAHCTSIQVCLQAELLCPGSYGVRRACLGLPFS